MDWLSSPDVYCTLIPLLMMLAVILFVALTIRSRRVRMVPEGYVLRLRRYGQHSRVVGPGLQMLRPDETDAGEVLVRQRELTLPISEVFTHGGLPVTVNLSLSLSLDLFNMSVDEIYYSDSEREAQLTKLLKGALQQVIAGTPPIAAAQTDPNRVDVANLFSPFVGQTRLAVVQQLQTLAIQALAPHGIRLTADPLVIAGLDLPHAIIEAYTDLVQSNFQSSARYDFIRRARAAAPGISDAALVQLSSPQNVGDLRTIFTTGSLQPELFVADEDTLMRRPAPQAQPQLAPTPPPAAPVEPAPAPPSHPFALTPEDMALLKPLPGMV